MWGRIKHCWSDISRCWSKTNHSWRDFIVDFIMPLIVGGLIVFVIHILQSHQTENLEKSNQRLLTLPAMTLGHYSLRTMLKVLH